MANARYAVDALPAHGRTLRRPAHSFQVRIRPWQIQPMLLAPVLPGETLKGALMQTRAVTDPLKNPLIGWWYEQYLFYVKHRDMPNSTALQNMVLSYGYDMSATVDAAKVAHYHAGAAIDFADECLQAVVPHFFRDDGEAMSTYMLDGLPAAKIGNETWLDSAIMSDAFPAGSTIAGGATAQAADAILKQYNLMRDMQLTTLTYEEFLRSFGVQGAQAEPQNKPELIRYVRDWTYPSNTINPTDGAPTSACSWSIAERADKDRFFPEPGFVFGCVVARPKVYLSKQVGAAAAMLTDAMTWLPAFLRGEPQTSLKEFAHNAGPLAGYSGANNDNYWVDVRDLFLYGDQFVNFALTETNAGMVALPTATMNKNYASTTDADALFVSSSANKIKADGVVSLTVAGSLRDMT